MSNFREKANLIWQIADFLRGRYRPAEYGKVILPFTVLRRLDLVLEPTKKDVLAAYEKHKDKKPEILEPVLNSVAVYQGKKLKFHNRSKYDFDELAKTDNYLAANLRNYINGFSVGAREIIDYFSFDDQIRRLEEYDLLYLVVKEFAKKGAILKDVGSMEMGYIFEELIRRFAEASNETAGDHFTPREVIRLMVNLLFVNEKNLLRDREGIIKTLYDPACGTGGMLSVAEEYFNDLNKEIQLKVFGQEINPESYAICKSDMLIKGQNPANIKFGNTFTQDGLENERFDYLLSNPPFGVDWKNAEKRIKDEAANRGFAGRFGAGLPPISDGSLLFLQHMISKMKPGGEGGSRIGIVFNGSPLFSGGAASGTSEIRRWIVENDWLEAIVALPDQLFYNTGISTYVWVVTDRKSEERRGRVQLVNASGAQYADADNPFYRKMMRSLGNKRKEICDGGAAGKPNQIDFITNLYFNFEENEHCKIFPNEHFGYWRVTIERPLRLRWEMKLEKLEKLDELCREIKDDEMPAFVRALAAKGVAEPLDYNRFVLQVKAFAKESAVKFTPKREKLFRDYCCVRSAEAAPIILKIEENELFGGEPTAADRFGGLFVLDAERRIFGRFEPDAELRDYENISLPIDVRRYYERDAVASDDDNRWIDGYFKLEVLPHVADAWIDRGKTQLGYEINFTKEFYQYKPLRSLAEIRAQILELEKITEGMIREVVET